MSDTSGGEFTATHAFRSEMGRILGYYDFAGVPKIVFPQYVANRHPEMTQQHEVVHADLCRSTSFGLFQKLLVLLLSQSPSTWETRSVVCDLLDHTINSSWLPQEVAAIYVSCATAWLGDPDSVQEHLQALGPTYEFALDPFLRLLPLDDISSNDSSLRALCYPSIMTSISAASLNNKVLEFFPSVDDLLHPDAMLRLDDDSPNKRFRIITEAVSHPDVRRELEDISRRTILKTVCGDSSSTPVVQDKLKKWFLDRGHVSLLWAKLEEYQIRYLREHIPDIHIVTPNEAIESSKRIFNRWQTDLERTGRFFLNSVAIKDTRNLTREQEIDATTKFEFVMPRTAMGSLNAGTHNQKFFTPQNFATQVEHFVAGGCLAFLSVAMITPENTSEVRAILGPEVDVEQKSIMLASEIRDTFGIYSDELETTSLVSLGSYPEIIETWSRLEKCKILSFITKSVEDELELVGVHLPEGVGYRVIVHVTWSLEAVKKVLEDSGFPEETFAIPIGPFAIVFSAASKKCDVFPVTNTAWGSLKHEVCGMEYKLLDGDDTEELVLLLQREEALNYAVLGLIEIFGLAPTEEKSSPSKMRSGKFVGNADLSDSRLSTPFPLRACPVCDGELVFDSPEAMSDDVAVFTCQSCSNSSGKRIGIALSKSGEEWK